MDMDKGIPSERFMNKVAAAYEEIYSGNLGNKELHPSFMELANAFNTSNVRIRRILITKGLYSTEKIQKVIRLREQGRSIEEIGKILGLKPSSVKANLPYEKGIYNVNPKTELGERVDRSRKRSVASKKLRISLACNKESDPAIFMDDLWKCIVLFQDYPFITSGRGGKGAVRFTYSLKKSSRTGKTTEEIVVSRKENSKTITRSTIELAFNNAVLEQRSLGFVKGPKRLRTFGASYLYAIFLKWHIINIYPT